MTLDFKEIEQKQIVLTSGKSEITLKGKMLINIHVFKMYQLLIHWFLKQKILKDLINETAFAASLQRESRPILTGVHFVLTDHKNLKTVATDSHRLSQRGKLF